MSDEVLLFEGLKVLDVGSWIAGPVAATMLADRGAEVLKIEVPEDGDGYRNWAMLPFTPSFRVSIACMGSRSPCKTRRKLV